MKFFAILALAAPLVFSVGCTTTPEGDKVFDSEFVSTELLLAELDLTELSTMLSDPELSAKIAGWAVAVGDVGRALDGYGDLPPIVLAEKALAGSDAFVEMLGGDDEAKVIVFVARAILRRVIAYSEEL